MKKETRITKELKGTPEATKKKDCKGCHEPEDFSNKVGLEEGQAKYNITGRTRNPSDPERLWEVTFEKWFGCYCTKKTATVTVKVDIGRIPLTKHLIKGGY